MHIRDVDMTYAADHSRMEELLCLTVGVDTHHSINTHTHTTVIMSAPAAAASSSSSSSTAPVDVDSFLREMTALERETELSRILSSFKMNPFDILNVNHRASRDEINKAYRAASLQSHPDKFPSGSPQREKAQQAFTLLSAAKDELLDETKRGVMDDLIDQARQKVLTNRAAAANAGNKKQKVDSASTPSSSPPLSDDADPSDSDPVFDLAVRAEVKEMLIEREWRKRQLLKAAAVEEGLAAKEKEQRAAEKESKEKEKKEWEEGREERISSWRDFQKGGKKGGFSKKMKMPKMQTADADSSFIKRPVTHQSSEK